MKAGSSNPMTWGWVNSSGAPVDSSGDTQLLEIRLWNGGCIDGMIVLSEAGDPGQSDFRFDSEFSEWAYNFQADDANGVPLERGNYCARVDSSFTGQSLTSPMIRVK
jgi:hypothetical protein